MLSRFHTIPACHGQTDRQTDGWTELLYQYRASVCWRAIKMESILFSNFVNDTVEVEWRLETKSRLHTRYCRVRIIYHYVNLWHQLTLTKSAWFNPLSAPRAPAQSITLFCYVSLTARSRSPDFRPTLLHVSTAHMLWTRETNWLHFGTDPDLTYIEDKGCTKWHFTIWPNTEYLPNCYYAGAEYLS